MGCKHAASNIKERESQFFSGAKTVVNFVKDGSEQVGKIPVIGNYIKQAADEVLDLPIPFTLGISLKTGLKTAENVVNTGNQFLFY